MSNKNKINIDSDGRVVVYLRKSRYDDSNDEGETLSKHRNQLEDVVQEYGFHNVEWLTEVGSANSIEGRPIFSKLLQRIQANQFDYVVVISFDRLTRGDTEERGIVQNALKDSDTLVITPSRIYDYNDEDMILLTDAEGMLAAAEYRLIKKRLYQGRVNNVKQGKIGSGLLPYGYKYDRNERRVEIVEDEAKVVRFMVSLFLDEGLSTHKIAERLNRDGVSTRKNTVWHRQTIVGILTNPIMSGKVFLGRWKHVDNTIVERDDYLINDGIHEAIIADDEQSRIKAKLNERTFSSKRKASHKFVLSNLVRCAICGSTMTMRKVSNQSRSYAFIKKCRALHPDGYTRCDGSTGIQAEVVEAALFERMKMYKNELMTKTDDAVDTLEDVAARNPIDSEYKKMADVEGRLERLKDLYIQGDVSAEDYEARKTIFNRELDAIQAHIKRLEADPVIERKKRRQNWADVDLDALFSDAYTDEQKNVVLKRLVDAVYFRTDDDAQVLLKIEYK